MIKIPKRTSAQIAQYVCARTDGELSLWTDGHVLLFAPADGEIETSGAVHVPSAAVIRARIIAPALAELEGCHSLWTLGEDALRMIRSDFGSLNWGLREGEFASILYSVRIQCPTLAFQGFHTEAVANWGYVCEALAYVLGRAPRVRDTVEVAWSRGFTALIMRSHADPSRGAIVMGVRR